ncbi:MAG TPA: GAF domain-containing protein [Solirubrobacteraceae bacterium]|nr:GAF domain-containing protein [Solirubrobacteraceae bacterium]
MLRVYAPQARMGNDALADRSEHGYIALASLARRLPSARDWNELASAVSQALGECEPAVVRLWAMASDGLHEMAQAPADDDARQLPALNPLELTRAAAASEAVDGPDGSVLVGLHAEGVTFGLLEVHGQADREVLGAVAPLIACRLAVLAAQGRGDVQLLPAAVGSASDASGVIARFARQAKRLLDHDRLSVYLLSHDGRAFERFAVATSAIVPGEGVMIPFEDVGLRHILLTNRAIVSSDLGADPRLIGAEDRVIARAGFRGLLSVPLRHDGRPFGVLNFVSRKAGFYRNEDIPIAEQIANQIAAFVENLRVQRRVQALVRREASERERSRVTRDLYQAVAHVLSEIRDGAALLERADDAGRGDAAAHIGEMARRGLTDVRRAIVDLDPPGLETGDLAEMAAQALDRFREWTGCDTSLEVDGMTADLPPTVTRATYRVLQEALMNVRRHARARSVTVRIAADTDLALVIEDDGVGFETRMAMQSEGLGLRHMRDRTDALGAFLAVTSQPGNGTTIRLKVPQVREVGAAGADDAGALEGTTTQDGALRVFVAEPNLLVRAGISRLIGAQDEMRVVGEAASLDETKARLRQLHPDVTLISTTLASTGSDGLIAEIRAASPSSSVLAISHGDIARDTTLLEAGATGVIDLRVDEEGLAQAVRAVACGTCVLGRSADATSGDPGHEALTQRERSILTLVACGETNAEIGRTLYLATKTVERQVATVVRKLGARNRAHAAAIAVDRHIVELEG